MKKFKVYEDEFEKKYVKACELGAIFGCSRRTISRLLVKMKQRPEYAGAYIRLSPVLTLVNLARFQQFLISLDGQYLKEKTASRP